MPSPHESVLNPYGLQFKVLSGRSGQVATKRLYFKSEAERGRYVQQLKNKGLLYDVDSYLDPKEAAMSLRKQVLKLAYDNPELRPHLLPLLREAAWGMPAPQRENWTPKGVEPYTPPGTDLVVYAWDELGKARLTVFMGRAQKPVEYTYFRDPAARDRYVESLAESRRKTLEFKQQRQEERKAWQHDLKVGDILSSSWGYDQTNISWFQVTRIGTKAVEIREIADKVVGGAGGPSEAVMPLRGKFIGPPMKKIPQKGYQGRATIRINSYSNAYPWDGKPEHQTGAMYGH